jgi:hypothetical protein
MACDVSHRFGEREIINTPDEVDDVAALTTSIANPAARPTVNVEIRTSPIKVKRAATHERGAGAPQLDAVASDQVADGMIGSKLLSVNNGSHVALARQRSD